MSTIIWWLQAGGVFLVVEGALLYVAFAIGFLRGEAQGNRNWQQFTQGSRFQNSGRRSTINIQ